MLSLILLALLLLATPAGAADCFLVTQSAAKVLNAGLTARERAAAEVERKRRKCPRKPVADGTPGAIDAETAAAVLPHIRSHLATVKLPAAQSKGKAKVVAKVKTVKARAKARELGVRAPLPQPRPPVAPSATEPAPLAPPVTDPASAPAAPAAALPPPVAPAPTRLERARAWLRKIW